MSIFLILKEDARYCAAYYLSFYFEKINRVKLFSSFCKFVQVFSPPPSGNLPKIMFSCKFQHSG